MVLWLRLHLPVRGVQIQSPIGELKSHMICDQKTQNIKLKQYCNKFNKDLKKKSTGKKKILKNKKNSVGCFLKRSGPQPNTLITTSSVFPTTLLPPATEIHFRFVSSFIQEFTPHKQIHCQIRKRKTSNTADKPGHRQGVRRLGGQV